MMNHLTVSNSKLGHCSDNLEIYLQPCERQQLKSPIDTHQTGAFIASSALTEQTSRYLLEGGLLGQGKVMVSVNCRLPR